MSASVESNQPFTIEEIYSIALSPLYYEAQEWLSLTVGSSARDDIGSHLRSNNR